MASLVIANGKLGPDKNDKIAQELLNAGNWRQALASVERRLKKTPSDERLLFNKNLILTVSDDAEKMEQGMGEIERLLRPEMSLPKLEFLRAIDQSLSPSNLSIRRSLSAVWERMQKAHPDNEQIHDAAFESYFNREEYSLARAAATKARLFLANKRIHFFKEIACSHLASRSVLCSDNEKQIFGKLASESAYKSATQVEVDEDFCQKFAELSVLDKKNLQLKAKKPLHRTSTAVQTIFDLQFVIYLLLAHGREEQALALLNDDTRTGLRSSIAAASWDLVGQKIDILRRLKKWEDIQLFCSELLLDAALEADGTTSVLKYSHGRAGDDWAIWRSLIEATCQLGRQDDFIKSGLLEDDRLKQRHRLLAAVELHYHLREFKNASQSLTAALATYQAKYQSMPAGFRDLSRYIPKLTASEKKEVLLTADRCARERLVVARASESQVSLAVDCVKSEIVALKLDYHVIVSAFSYFTSIPLLESFVSNCLRLYEISLRLDEALPPTERRCGDDAAILAAIACLRLFHEGRAKAQLQATLILEKLLTHSKHNYEAILLIVRLYLCQGAFSKAFDFYTRLDIKNVQIFTEAWVLLTRISTLYPHGAGKHGEVRTLLKSYNDYINEKIESVPRISRSYINQENFKGLCEAREFFAMCKGSISRFLLRAELSRIDWRKSACDGEEIDDDPIEIKDIWTDIREVSGFPQYEHEGQPHIEQYARTGPVPWIPWIGIQSCLMDLRRCFHGKHPYKNVENIINEASDRTGTRADDYVTHVLNESPFSSVDLTPCEAWSGKPIHRICAALMAIVIAHREASGGNTNKNDALSLSHSAQGWALKFLREDEEIAHWDANFLKRAEDFLASATIEVINAFEAYGLFDTLTANPVKVFEARAWEVLHVYYMTSELCAFYVGVLTVAVAFSRRLVEAAQTFPLLARLGHMTNIDRWQDALNSAEQQCSAILKEYQQSVRILRAHWRDGENIKGLVDGILEKGTEPVCLEEFKESIKMALPHDFVMEKCRELADSWVDGLNGVFKEQDSTSWFMSKMN